MKWKNYWKISYAAIRRKRWPKWRHSGARARNAIYLATDFDRTITPYANEKGEELTTWGLLSRKLPPDVLSEEVELYNKFRPLEVSGKMTDGDAFEWWSKNLDLYGRSRLKFSDLAHEVEDAIPARPGAKELFGICEKKEIPAVIVSAGIKDVIELWCRKYEVRPEVILSTKLYFDAEGYICGWDKDSLVHTLNKKEMGKKFLDAMQKRRPRAILVGDSADDAAMVDGTDNVLRFFIDDRKDEHMRNHDFYDNVFEKFDLIIQSGSLLPIVETIESM